MRRFLFFIFALCTWPALLHAQDSIPRVRILFIGNSYTYFHSMPATLQLMAIQRAKPVAIEIAQLTPGGMTLRGHYLDSAKVARDAIRNGKWDYVMIQEQSLAPITVRDTVLFYASRFVDEIRAAGARPLVYATWPRKTRPTSLDTLNATFDLIASRTGAKLVPVGNVWRALQRADSTIDLYWMDGSHPGAIGSYAAAATLYHAIFNEPPPTTAVMAYETHYAERPLVDATKLIRIPPKVAAAVRTAVSSTLR